MDTPLQIAARDVLEVLLWFADQEAPRLGGVPVMEFILTPGPEVARLQGYYPPHRRLPGKGQELWRELQGMTDREFSGREQAWGEPEDVVRLHQTCDRLASWLVDFYELAEPTPAAPIPVPKSSKPAPRPDPRARRFFLLTVLSQRHVDEEGGKQFHPYSQPELRKLLDFPQPALSRHMNEVFPDGGMKHYKALCRSRKIDTYLKQIEAGDRRKGGEESD